MDFQTGGVVETCCPVANKARSNVEHVPVWQDDKVGGCFPKSSKIESKNQVCRFSRDSRE